jgi:hypothetical protein
MNVGFQSGAGYSADVSLRMLVAGSTYELSHVAPDFVRLRTPVEIPPSDAEIIVSVDGRESTSRVRLPNGASRGESQVRILKLSLPENSANEPNPMLNRG